MVSQSRTVCLEPGEDVAGKPGVVGAGFNELNRAFRSSQPFGELKGEQLTKETAHADTGKKITGTPSRCTRTRVVSNIGTIQGQFHEAGEGYCALGIGFFGHDGAEILHCERVWPVLRQAGHKSC